jgi:N6-adenosine-specific RNA methylase IME4
VALEVFEAFGRYGTLLVDPPWSYEFATRKGPRQNDSPGVPARDGVQAKYECLTHDQLLALPVGLIAADDALLWLWATNKMLPKAFELVEAWGFDYKTMLTWIKKTVNGKTRAGMGYWMRGATEHVLLGGRGKVKPGVNNQPTFFEAPVERHSAKPDFVRDLAMRHGPGPCLEMFARKPYPGWEVWGNEVQSDLTLVV